MTMTNDTWPWPWPKLRLRQGQGLRFYFIRFPSLTEKELIPIKIRPNTIKVKGSPAEFRKYFLAKYRESKK